MRADGVVAFNGRGETGAYDGPACLWVLCTVGLGEGVVGFVRGDKSAHGDGEDGVEGVGPDWVLMTGA